MKRALLLLTLLLACGVGAWATVPDVPFTVTYTCAGGFGPFPFSYPISDPTALTVTLNGVLLSPANYTTTPVNNNYNNGGSVTLDASHPCVTGSLMLTRVTPLTQTIKYYDGMPTPFTTFGRSVDKLTEIAQELHSGGTGGGASIQMQNNGVNFLLPSTTLTTFNFINCTVGGIQDTYTITCSGSGGGGNVTGPGSSVIGHLSVWTDTIGQHLGDTPVSSDGSGNMTTAGNFQAAQGTFTGPPYGMNFLGFNASTPSGFGAAGTCAIYPLDTPNRMVKKCDGGTVDPLAVTNGSLINGNCAKYDSTGRLVDAGAPCGTGSGTVTSVAMTGDNTVFNSSVTGSPITTSGTFAPSLHTQSANTVLAGPTSGGDVAPTFRAIVVGDLPVSVRACEQAWGGSGTSFALQSGDDSVVNNSCYNDTGATWTITAVKCRSDAASNSVTINPTFGSDGTGTTLLSGALTCGSSYAMSSSGTIANAAVATGNGFRPVMGGTLTGSTSIVVHYDYTVALQ